MEIFSYFNEAYEIRAFLASSLVGVTCGLLGCFIVLRNMAMIGDALSHAILPGVVAGFIIAGYSILAFFVGAVLAGFIAAILITWLQRNVRTREDSAIGIIFTVMFAIGVIGISNVNRSGAHLDLKDFLFGTVLGVSDQDLLLTSIIAIFVLISVILFFRQFFISSFQPVVGKTFGISTGAMHYFLMLLLSFTIVASLQSVGVILVVAMLIIPASTALVLTNHLKNMLILGAFFGVLSTFLGMLLANMLNIPPGPSMTVVAGIIYGLTLVFAPQRGILFKYLRKQNKKELIALEDSLKRIWHQEVAKTSSKHIPQHVFSKNEISKLKAQGFITLKNAYPQLTDEGRRKAIDIVRAHRLWETYLHELGLTGKTLHDQAEKLEHLLPKDFLDKIDLKLGFPDTDSHGSPIPRNNEEENAKPIVLKKQSNPEIIKLLWENGFELGMEILMQPTEDGVQLKYAQKEISISTELAKNLVV